MHRTIALIVLTALGFGLRSMEAQGDRALDATAVHRALDDFQDALEQRWSYRFASRADFGAPIAALRLRAATGMSVDDLGLELHKVLALGIDGHSSVIGYQLPGNRYLPFLIEPDGDRFIAFKPDRTAFLDDGFPYLAQIDGSDTSEWCAAAAVIVPKGSPQYLRHRCAARLRSIDFVRDVMRRPKRDTVDVALVAKDGKTRRSLTVRLGNAPPPYGVWPRAGSRVFSENVGYLRLAYLDQASSVQEIKQWMPAFRETRGLVIDVRDNDGGDRDALRLIYSYLAAAGDPPHVFTAAAYRLHTTHPDDYLATNHRMYRKDAVEWSDAQRAAIAEFTKTFKPEWQLPIGQFSDWHYMALDRLTDVDIYHYDKPVVVLMNGKSFSATDIFLAGLKGMKNVTLLGTPSAGGSAYTQEVTLGATPLRVRIGSMASFQADGRLFDGHGVRPDVIVEPTPEYYVGGPDNVLAEALKRLGTR